MKVNNLTPDKLIKKKPIDDIDLSQKEINRVKVLYVFIM
jgi:hypothetical protein